MTSANIIFAVCCFICSLSFWGIAIWAFVRKSPMHFWSGSSVKPEEISDIPSYNRANGWMWTIYASCLVLAGIISLFNIGAGTILLVILFVPGVVVLILVYNKIYNKYKSANSTNTYSGTSNITSSWTSKKAFFRVLITVIALAGVAVMLVYGEQEPNVMISNDSIRIKGMYGLSITFSEVADIQLIDKSMKEIGVGRRTNGYGGFMDTLKGNFKSEALGETLLFVHANSSPTIKIERKGKKDIYISYEDTERAKMLYNDLMKAYAK